MAPDDLPGADSRDRSLSDDQIREHASEGSLERTSTEQLPGRSKAPVEKPIDTPPNGGYGWVCVACVFLINAHTWGINSSYGVFLNHYLATDAFPSATSLDYAFVGGISISVALLVSPLATISVRRLGTSATLLVGVVFETAALLGASWATRIWQLFLSQGACFGVGMGFLFVASVGVIPQWFTTRRSFANSIGTAGSGIGGLVYSLASNAMIERIGLGWAFRILAVVTFVVNTICAILMRDRNTAVGAVHTAFDARLLKRFEFDLLLLFSCFSLFAYVVLVFSLPNYAQSIGLSATQGSLVGAMFNLGQGVGRPFVGYFSDAVGRINMAGGGTLLAAIFCLAIWINAKTFGVLMFFAIIGGTVAGTLWTTIAPVSAEVVGMQKLPSALAIVWLAMVLPATFAEAIGLQLRTGHGDEYLHAQLFAGFMYLGGAICLWFLRAWKVKEVEELAAEQKEKAGEKIVSEANMTTALERKTSQAASVKSKAKAAKGLWTWQRV